MKNIKPILTKKCQMCGIVFEKSGVTPRDYFINKRKYCGMVCHAMSKKIMGIKPPTRTGCVPWNAGLVGFRAKELNNFWKGGKPNCPECGKKLSRRESKHCVVCRARINNSGNKSSFWKGGVSIFNKTERNILMRKTEYIQWRLSVMKRDLFTCVTCKQTGVSLVVHHIKPWSLFPNLRYEMNNGVTLCQNCHILIHKN